MSKKKPLTTYYVFEPTIVFYTPSAFQKCISLVWRNSSLLKPLPPYCVEDDNDAANKKMGLDDIENVIHMRIAQGGFQ